MAGVVLQLPGHTGRIPQRRGGAGGGTGGGYCACPGACVCLVHRVRDSRKEALRYRRRQHVRLLAMVPAAGRRGACLLRWRHRVLACQVICLVRWRRHHFVTLLTIQIQCASWITEVIGIHMWNCSPDTIPNVPPQDRETQAAFFSSVTYQCQPFSLRNVVWFHFDLPISVMCFRCLPISTSIWCMFVWHKYRWGVFTHLSC